MLRVAGVLLGLALYIWFIVDVARTPRTDVRTLPKFVWLILVLVLPLLGGVLWLIAGRPRSQRPMTIRRSCANWTRRRGASACVVVATAALTPLPPNRRSSHSCVGVQAVDEEVDAEVVDEE